MYSCQVRALCCVLFILTVATESFAGTRVIETVLSGDQVQLEGGWISRIAGVIAPAPDEPGGQEVLAFARRELEGKRVRFSTWTTDNTAAGIVYDENQRPFATIEYGENYSICFNELLIERGLARVDTLHLPDYHRNLVDMELQAKAEHRGLWAEE